MECSPTADIFQVLSGVGGKRRNFDAYEWKQESIIRETIQA
jgi:hypothetical protein